MKKIQASAAAPGKAPARRLFFFLPPGTSFFFANCQAAVERAGLAGAVPKQMYQSIYGDSKWRTGVVENLLL